MYKFLFLFLTTFDDSKTALSIIPYHQLLMLCFALFDICVLTAWALFQLIDIIFSYESL